MIPDRFSRAVPVIVLPFILIACGEDGSTTSDRARSNPPGWVLASAPEQAEGVKAAKAHASEGDEVVVRGRIGGRVEPISDGSSTFTVIDLELLHCGQNPGDTCPTPWDYCCETPETINANGATVQIVDNAGRAVEGSPADFGFEPLDEVIVIGVVGPRPDERVLVVRARGVHRVQ